MNIIHDYENNQIAKQEIRLNNSHQNIYKPFLTNLSNININ